MREQWSTATSEHGQTFVFREVGEGPMVILLHGFPDTPHGWERTVQALAGAGHRAVAPWLRGYHPDTVVHGRGYDPLTLADDPVALMDALGEQSAVIAGHDWGSVISQWSAGLHPERVRAIVPIALPHQSLLPRNLRIAWEARHFIHHKTPWAEWSIRRNDFKQLDRLYRRWAPNWSGRAREECLANAKRCFGDPRCLSGALAYYRAIPLGDFPEPIAQSPEVTALVVAGTTDIPPPLQEHAASLLGPGSEVTIVDGAGHWPHREGEEQFIAALLAFLRRLDGQPTAG